MELEKKEEKTQITIGQMLLVLVYVLYVTYKYVYGTETVATFPPFALLCLDVVQYIGAILIGKKIGPKLTNFIAQEIEVLINPRLKEEERITSLEQLIRWALIDVNQFYEKQHERFRTHFESKGYFVRAQKEELKKEEPKKEEVKK